MTTDKTKYVKQDNGGYRTTSVKLPDYLIDTLKACNINVSGITRDFLEDYLKENFPKELIKAKKIAKEL